MKWNEAEIFRNLNKTSNLFGPMMSKIFFSAHSFNQNTVSSAFFILSKANEICDWHASRTIYTTHYFLIMTIFHFQFHYYNFFCFLFDKKKIEKSATMRKMYKHRKWRNAEWRIETLEGRHLLSWTGREILTNNFHCVEVVVNIWSCAWVGALIMSSHLHPSSKPVRLSSYVSDMARRD